jgi:hypothetical protein
MAGICQECLLRRISGTKDDTCQSYKRRGGTAMGRMAATLAAVTLAVAVAGCSSSGSSSHTSGAVQTGAGGPALVGAQPRASAKLAGHTVRLGFVAEPSDGIALVGVEDGLFRKDLGAGEALAAVRFSSSAAAERALTRGQLDAAYLNPVATVEAWQATREGIRVVAGAASTAGRSSALLVVATRFLTFHSFGVQGLLKGQVQAMQLLNTDPISARRMAAAELTKLGDRMSPTQFAHASSGSAFNCDPLQSSVFAQAQQAAKAGRLKAVTSLTAMYDLVPVDQLLKSAGFRLVSHTAE